MPAVAQSDHAQAAHHVLLTPAEEVALAKRVALGDEGARRAMVEANLRLVVSVAKRFRGLGLDFDDLVQEGSIGLIRAVDGFDSRRGTRLSTYAIFWIRQAIMRALGETSQTIRVPSHVGDRQRALRRTSPSTRSGPGSARSWSVASGSSASRRRVWRSATSWASAANASASSRDRRSPVWPVKNRSWLRSHRPPPDARLGLRRNRNDDQRPPRWRVDPEARRSPWLPKEVIEVSVETHATEEHRGGLDELAGEPFISLTTFKRDGTPVSTPVWVAGDGGRLLVLSDADTWKVKRIRRDGHVRVAPCGARGKVHGDAVEAEARILADTSLVETLEARKYGCMYRATGLLRALVGRLHRRPASEAVTIEIVSAAGPPSR